MHDPHLVQEHHAVRHLCRPILQRLSAQQGAVHGNVAHKSREVSELGVRAELPHRPGVVLDTQPDQVADVCVVHPLTCSQQDSQVLQDCAVGERRGGGRGG